MAMARIYDAQDEAVMRVPQSYLAPLLDAKLIEKRADCDFGLERYYVLPARADEFEAAVEGLDGRV